VLHTRRSLAPWQLAAPGLHTRMTHAPASQPSPAAQGASVKALPSGLHTRRVVASAQVAMPAAQAAAWQVFSRHAWPMGQSVSAAHWTQAPRATSHTSPGAEQSRDEVHRGGGGTQALSRQTVPPVQSTSVAQSTQKPRRALQTWPGHIRDEVQGVGVMQRLPMHIRPLVQSPAPLHSTQAPRAALQTSPIALHSRSETQRGAAASSGRSVAASARSVAASAGGGDGGESHPNVKSKAQAKHIHRVIEGSPVAARCETRGAYRPRRPRVICAAVQSSPPPDRGR